MNEEIRIKLADLLADRERDLNEIGNLSSLDTEIAAVLVYRLYAIEDAIINVMIDISDDDYYEVIKVGIREMFEAIPKVTINDLLSARIKAIKLYDEQN